MARRFYFEDNDSIELSSNGTYLTDPQSIDYETAIIVVAAYDSNGDIVTPTAGTVTIEASPIDGQWHGGISGGVATIDMTTTGSDATYDMPVIDGPIYQARISISDVLFVSEVDHVKAYIWRA